MLRLSIFIQYFCQYLFVCVYHNIGSFHGRLILRIQRHCSRTRHQRLPSTRHYLRPSTRHHRRPSTQHHRRPSTRLLNRRPLSTHNRHHRRPLTTNTRQAPLTVVTSKSPTNHLANSTRSWRLLRSKTPKNRQCCTNSERSQKRTATSTRRLRITIIIKRWTLRRRWTVHRH